MNEVEFLRARLAEEQANLEQANKARQDAEARYRVAERERDMYKILARTLRSRLNRSSSDGSNNPDDIIEETAAEMMFGGRTPFSTFGLGRMLRLISQDRSDEEMGEDDNEDFEFLEEGHDDDDSMSEAMENVASDDEDDSDNDDESLSDASDHQDTVVNSTSTSSNMRQIRTVSISEADLR